MAAAPLYVIGIKPLMAQMKALIESFQPMCLDRPSDHASRQRNAGRLRTVGREVRKGNKNGLGVNRLLSLPKQSFEVRE